MSPTSSSRAAALARPPVCRGSTKVCRPVRVIRPGRFAPISRSSRLIAPAGHTYASMASRTARSIIRGDQVQWPPITRRVIPSCANVLVPRRSRSPSPKACRKVRPRGWPWSRKRRSSADSRASGSSTPPPEPVTATVAPSAMRRTASAAVARTGPPTVLLLSVTGFFTVGDRRRPTGIRGLASTGRRCRRAADHRLGGQHGTGTGPVAGQQAAHRLPGHRSDLLLRAAHGGQRRGDVPGDRDVVVSGHGHVFGYPYPLFGKPDHDADRDEVVVGQHRRRLAPPHLHHG